MLDFLFHDVHPFAHVGEFTFGGPAGGLTEAAVGGEDEAVGGCVFQAQAHAVGDVFGSFYVLALHIDDPDGDVHARGDL